MRWGGDLGYRGGRDGGEEVDGYQGDEKLGEGGGPGEGGFGGGEAGGRIQVTSGGPDLQG